MYHHSEAMEVIMHPICNLERENNKYIQNFGGNPPLEAEGGGGQN
jgi:hypothetical protein